MLVHAGATAHVAFVTDFVENLILQFYGIFGLSCIGSGKDIWLNFAGILPATYAPKVVAPRYRKRLLCILAEQRLKAH